MNPDLVRSPRFQPALHKRGRRKAGTLVELPEGFQGPVMGNRVTSGIALFLTHDGHLLAISGRARNRHVDRAHQGARGAAREREIGPFDIMGLEQSRQTGMCRFRLCNGQYACGVLVDAVNDARTLYPANAR